MTINLKLNSNSPRLSLGAGIVSGVAAKRNLCPVPFNKQSTRELCEQIVRNLLLPKWSEEIAVEIDPPKLKAWLVVLDVESSTRGKYKSIMSGVYNWGQCEG